MTYTATYSPEDNKLRLYASSRLDPETYARVKSAGYIWAPKQGFFVAPMWTPEREDVALELAGEIGDEDTSLVERAEERAERFEDYSDKRESDAHRARSAVEAISSGIPFGQPILIGHHSERHARKDAERIENGMRKAVKMWETSKYWEDRAAGALRHAAYKELPAVRARRIKGLESDLRKQEGYIKHAEAGLKAWTACAGVADAEAQRLLALRICGTYSVTLPRKEGDRPDFDQRPDAHTALTNYYPNLYAPRTVAEVIEAALSDSVYPRSIEHHTRWANHYRNRLAYEKAMLGTPAGEKWPVKVGGRVLSRGEWLVILKVNKAGGVVNSVTTNARHVSIIGIEDVQDYREPETGDTEKVKAATKLAPLVNFKSEGCIEMTAAEWKAKTSGWGDSHAVRRFNADGEMIWRGETAYRQRSVYRISSKCVPVFLTDSKVIEAPKAKAERVALPPRVVDADALAAREARLEAYQPPTPTVFDEMKTAIRTGVAVQVVSAPQLFPTPPELAARMVEEAGVQPGETVLEPSAGTGNIVRAVIDAADTEIVGYEINPSLTSALSRTFPSYKLHAECRDFLTVTEGMGRFPVVLMNPPFANAQDIVHIKHAVKFLKPGGRLVAICAGGSRQERELKPLAENSGGIWEPLPPNTFASAGTGVNTVLLTIYN